MADEPVYRTLACGCELLWCADLREYMARLVEHVRQCEKAQQIMIEKCREVKHG